MVLYKLINQIMKDRDIRIADIAKMCDLPDSTVRGIVRRKQETVALDVAFKLSDGLGVPLQELNDMPVDDDSVPEDKKATGISSDGKYSGIIEKLDRLTPEQVCRVEGFVDCMLMEAAETTAEQTNVKLA